MKRFNIDTLLYVKEQDGNYLYLEGWFVDSRNPDAVLQVSNGKLFPDAEMTKKFRADVASSFQLKGRAARCGFFLRFKVEDPQAPVIIRLSGHIVFKASAAILEKALVSDPIVYQLVVHEEAGMLTRIDGWAMVIPEKKPEVLIRNAQGHPVSGWEIHWNEGLYSGMFATRPNEAYGFILTFFPMVNPEGLQICFRFKEKEIRIPLEAGQAEALREAVNRAVFEQQCPVLEKLVSRRIYNNMLKRRPLYLRSTACSYDTFFKEQFKEREQQPALQPDFDWKPLISILVPAYNPDPVFFQRLLQSLLEQSYPNWELVIGDGLPNSTLWEQIRSYTDDPRIRYIHNDRVGDTGISANTNAAASIARGDYYAFLDHDDVLDRDALYYVVQALNQYPYSYVYSDEDKVETLVTDKGMEDVYSEYAFKPDFSRDTLRSTNYICHFSVVSRELFKQVGGLRSRYDGAQDYDFVLRCSELVDASDFCHIPRVLYHWRKHAGSTAGAASAKDWAFEAGRLALADHLERIGISAQAESLDVPGLYQVKYELKGEPLISIVIPTKDHVEDLDRCVQSILKKASYTNYEILVVENNSTEPATFEYYRQLEQQDPRIRILYWKKPFNYSAINNFAAAQAKGELLLLLNNDTEVESPDFLQAMAANALRPEVGAVGIRLLYENDLIQHNGVLMLPSGPAHLFLMESEDSISYLHWKKIQRTVSAVTAAALMVRKALFEQVGGMDETLRVAYNDVDFCMKLTDQGYDNVILPYVRMHHYESLSRGSDKTPARAEEFLKERATLLSRWEKYVLQGDPYYNINLKDTAVGNYLSATLETENPDWRKRKRDLYEKAMKETVDDFLQ